MTKKLQLIIACFAGLIIIFFIGRTLVQNDVGEQTEDSYIKNTNGILHTVALDDILSGGPEENDISPLTNPQFISIEAGNTILSDTDLGVSFEYGGVKRFYPLRILGWHQVVNDTLADLHICVTYSPLTNSAAIFRSYVDGQQTFFTNSGKLWDSNIVLIDNKTRSEWSQIKAEAIVGPQSGEILEMLPTSMTTFGQWKTEHLDGEILENPKDSLYDYTRDPNQAYYESDVLYFPTLKEDTRLSAKATILGVKIGDSAKAYPIEAIEEKDSISDSINGTKITISHASDGVIHVATSSNNETTEFPAMQIYWFAWVGAYPDTLLYTN